MQTNRFCLITWWIYTCMYTFLIIVHLNAYRHSTLIWFYCNIIIFNRLSNKILSVSSFSLHYYSKRDDHNHHLFFVLLWHVSIMRRKKNVMNRMNKKSLISHCVITCDNIVEEKERDKCLMSIRLTTVDFHICAYHIARGHLSSLATAVFTNKLKFWLIIKSNFIVKLIL